MRPRFRALKPASAGLAVGVLAALVLPVASAQATPDRGRVVIAKNSQFDAKHGVRSGRGTRAAPYVIAGWDLSSLEIHDTSKCVLIRNNVINRLVLNWTGGCTTVVKNRVGDLRVNQNVKRTGDRTSGAIVRNKFSIVGQLRHWDGVFAHNVVGEPEEDNYWFEWPFSSYGFQAVNFDGFNGAVFKNNTIHGYMQARLHGHHHSSSFEGGSHYHGSGKQTRGLNHMRRFHRVTITGNTIYSKGPYGLIYTDSAHSANDRTAASEQNPALNNPHMHFTRVAVTNNRLVGSGIVVNIFNARDQKHLRTQTGRFTIARNRITLKEYRDTLNLYNDPPAGISVWDARDLHLHIVGNRVLGPAEKEGEIGPVSDTLWGSVPAGIRLDWVNKAWIHIIDNQVTNRDVGIYARSFDNVTWWVKGFKTEGVAKRVDYDNSSNPPNRRP